MAAGSFSAAAKILGVGQPSVSRRVHALEHQLGVSLPRRTTRQLSLTEAGTRNYEAAQRALAALEEARHAARDASGRVRGRLRITAPVSFSTAWLAPRIGEFSATHPDVDLHLFFSEQHVDLVEAGMDWGIRIGGPQSAQLKGRRLGSLARRLVAGRARVNRHGLPKTPEDLEPARPLVFAAEPGWRGWAVSFEGRPALIRPRQTTSASSGDFLRVLVLAGEGVCMLEPSSTSSVVGCPVDRATVLWITARHAPLGVRSRSSGCVAWFSA